ncbi:glycoside hydrolase family 10 protein [Hyaloscypha bicolor E]|uniref:Beta-xylanase n=1 Tax=Hyaloscypha bicolor E TaxID=1095630 RepID=A0A2J6SIJ5_9HELO|nr:glycoside hydrolase family 10 protein [Hyaloscypha bicolor E]PMD50587.1 glycoside hydrolase family 10 protein [Hyaloscypha bicolor E]
MRFQAQVLAVAAAVPPVSAQLNDLAKAAGKLYFGTATDNMELNLRSSKKNGQLLRCHNLVWHSQLAPWALINHVTDEAKYWARQCYAWDVLNEALNDDGTYRNDTFLTFLGPYYIKIALKVAAAADSHAKLYYNDYGIEHVGNKPNAARANIIKFLQDDGIKIDGVRLQSHFTVGRSPSLDEQIADMREFADMGSDMAVTELDVRLLEPENNTNLASQSEAYKNTLEHNSWTPGVFAGYGSAGLWFANFTKHPAYQGIVDAFKNGTVTITSPVTVGNGTDDLGEMVRTTRMIMGMPTRMMR